MGAGTEKEGSSVFIFLVLIYVLSSGLSVKNGQQPERRDSS